MKNRKLLYSIDIGNNSVDIAEFENSAIIRRVKILNNEIPLIYDICSESGTNVQKKAMICSVVPQIKEKVILQLKKSGIERPFSVQSAGLADRQKLLKNAYPELGEDRLIGLFMANIRYAKPLIMVDLGSAITLDAVDKDGAYAGGIILPGIGMWASALSEKTALLPEVKFTKCAEDSPLLGHTTEQCIQAGFQYGLTAMINRLIEKIQLMLDGTCTVILAGGDAEDIKRYIHRPVVMDDTLVLSGLHELFIRTEVYHEKST